VDGIAGEWPFRLCSSTGQGRTARNADLSPESVGPFGSGKFGLGFSGDLGLHAINTAKATAPIAHRWLDVSRMKLPHAVLC
jgi:hypothetical protein